MNRFLWLLSVICLSCTKPPLVPDQDPIEMKYALVDQTWSYGKQLSLFLDQKEKSVIVFDTELIINNGKPYTIFTVKPTSPLGHTLLLSPHALMPYGQYFASAVIPGFAIYEQPTGQKRWGSSMEKGLLLAVCDNGKTAEFAGSWHNKQRMYLGIALQMDDGVHYGWVSLSHTAGKKEMTVHEWAYSTKPHRIVKAGWF